MQGLVDLVNWTHISNFYFLGLLQGDSALCRSEAFAAVARQTLSKKVERKSKCSR